MLTLASRLPQGIAILNRGELPSKILTFLTLALAILFNRLSYQTASPHVDSASL